MRAVDAYLSRRAARIWPGAVVTCRHEDRDDWWLDRPRMESVLLGESFREARQSLRILADDHARATADELARIRDRVAQERRATERLLRVVSGESDDGYASTSDAWHTARRLTDEALGVTE